MYLFGGGTDVMTFSEWFEGVFRHSDEQRTRAIARLHVETGVSPMSCRRALAGTKVRSGVAARLACFTQGAVSAESLRSAPASTAVGSASAEPTAAPATDPSDAELEEENAAA
jgi:hypothetical protein